MKHILISLMIMLSMTMVQAATICDAKIALADARLNLMMMVMSTDKVEQDALRVEINTASTNLDGAVGAMLKDENKTDDVQLNSFNETWTAFRNTRETEIIPAVYAGDNDKAIAIATGVQAERMAAMDGVIQALNGDNCSYE
ncbi:MCP four helix bundle domain-containing protein [Thiotrichales bacterium HSG1]|nr:MCP four helix bundle domain-containing protein [Thiotrichales bacterium HSG1]